MINCAAKIFLLSVTIALTSVSGALAQEIPRLDIEDPSELNGTYFVRVHSPSTIVGRGRATLKFQGDDNSVKGTWRVVRRVPLAHYPVFEGPVEIEEGRFIEGVGLLYLNLGRGFTVLARLNRGQLEDPTDGEFSVFRGGWQKSDDEDFRARYGGLVQLSSINR